VAFRKPWWIADSSERGMSIPAHLIAAARSVQIERVIEERGIKLRGRVERSGPCPRCGGRDRFSINTRKQIFLCRQCQRAGDVISLVQFLDGVNLRDAVESLTNHRPHPAPKHKSIQRDVAHNVPESGTQSATRYEQAQHAKARWLWARRQPITGSIAERYLRRVRGIIGPYPPTLGYLPPSKPEHHPAMIAAYGLPESTTSIITENKITAVQITLLKPDGSGKADIKPNKITIGSPADMPMVLAPINDLLGLAICEGVEDALSVHQATGLGAWASGGASFMPKLAATVPDYVEAVTIFAHDDEAGQRGAIELAEALTRRGIEVRHEGITLCR
jgi:phage/plasmid primase-like uncharacterized protein